MEPSMWSDFWAAVFGRIDHPVYRRELSGFSYFGFLQTLHRGCLPLMLVVILVPMCACGFMAVAIALPAEAGLLTPIFMGYAALFGVMIGGEWVLGLAGLVVTALTATTISGEIESQSYALLRMSPVKPRQIVLSKFGAALKNVRPAVITTVLLRAIFPAGLILWTGFSLIYAIMVIGGSVPPTPPSSAPSPTPIVPPAAVPLVGLPIVAMLSGLVQIFSLGVVSIVAGLLTIFYYLSQPFLITMLHAAVGMFGSSMARSRANGLFTAAGLRMALGAVTYFAAQFFSMTIQILSFPLFLSPTTSGWIEANILSNPSLVGLGMALFWILWEIILIAAPLGTTFLLLRWTIRRAEKLPYNS